MMPEDRVAMWISHLKSKDPMRRRLAACVLGIMGSAAKRAESALTDALYDEDSTVRRYAAIALGRIACTPEASPHAHIGML